MKHMVYTWKQWRWIGLWGVNLVIIVAVWAATSAPLIGTGYFPTLLALARLSGLLAGFTVLVQLWLIGRGRWLEEDFGLDRLTRIHRWNGYAALVFVLLHVPTLILAYSSTYNSSPPQTLLLLFQNFEDTLKAFIAELALFAIIISSLVIVRRKLRYEWWYFIHLLTYVVVIFSFGHQVHNGRELMSIEWFRTYWYLLFAGSLGSLVLFRFVRPLYLWYRFRFRISRIESESSNVVSLYITGRDINKFSYQAGQFAKFWILVRGYWLEIHPYTISIEPGGEEIRITAKALGDYSTRLAKTPLNTPIIIDGPYGRFTSLVATQKRLVFIAGGIGITPIRAILGGLAEQKDKRELWLFYSAKTQQEIIWREDFKQYAKKLNLTIRYILSDEEVPDTIHGLIDASTIRAEISSLKNADFYICGPAGMLQSMRSDLQANGVSTEDIHYEQFSLIRQ